MRGAWAAQLEQSQAFHAPDCVERMARVYGVTQVRAQPAVHRVVRASALRASHITPSQHATLVLPPQSAAVSANVAALASALKSETQSAWAAEAVRRGVAHAKAGDLEAALRCYAQALELDAAHRDAHVARGAALANCGRLREGREACEAALRLDPSDRNAREYLDAITAKMAAQAAEPEPEPAAAAMERAVDAPPPSQAAPAPPAAVSGAHARGIEPPGPVAQPATAGAPHAKAEVPVAAALHDALRAAADKLRHKHKHKRKHKHKHDSSAKKSKKVRWVEHTSALASQRLRRSPSGSTRRGRRSAPGHRRAAAAAAAAAVRTAAPAGR